MMSLEIERAENGFVVEYERPNYDPPTRVKKVFGDCAELQEFVGQYFKWWTFKIGKSQPPKRQVSVTPEDIKKLVYELMAAEKGAD